MRAIDTNVAARYLLNDDSRQAALAADIIRTGIHLSTTVLMELGWLLASRYAQPREAIAASLADLVDLGTVHVDDPEGVTWALGRYAAGADLADMLHLVGATPAARFTTFDRAMARNAGEAPPIAVETLV